MVQAHDDDWDYCQITFQTRQHWGGPEQPGLNLGWLWFVATTRQHDRLQAVGKSPAIPFGRLTEGFPSQRNPVHVSLYQHLVDELVRAGWQPLAERGANWWEQRFRRKPPAG